MEYRRIDNRLGVFVVVAEDILAFGVGDSRYQSSIRILRGLVGEVFESGVYGLVGADVIHDHASPHASLFERVEVKAGDDSKVVAATPQREVEIGMRGIVDVYS